MRLQSYENNLTRQFSRLPVIAVYMQLIYKELNNKLPKFYWFPVLNRCGDNKKNNKYYNLLFLSTYDTVPTFSKQQFTSLKKFQTFCSGISKSLYTIKQELTVC